MAVDVLPTAAIVTRLKGQVAAFELVEGSAELDAAMRGGARKLPACFVVFTGEKSSVVTKMPGAVHQRVIDQFDVVYAVKNARGRGGAASVEGDLRGVRIAAMQALIGWSPAPAFGACEHDSGALIALASGVIWWKDRFKTDHYNTV